MIRNIVAAQLIVRDLATSTAFYRDTLGLKVDDSGPDFAMFKVGDLYFFLQEATSVVQMMSEEPLDLRLDGGSRSLIAASVDDVDTMYADLKAKGSTSSGRQPISRGGCARHTLPIPKATTGRSTDQ